MRNVFAALLFLVAFLGLTLAVILLVERPPRPGRVSAPAAPQGTGEAGTPPAAPAVKADVPKAAVIMDDLGNNVEAMRRLAGLGIPVTAAVLPFAPATRAAVETAREAGLELALHLPLEAAGPMETNAGRITEGMTGPEIRGLVESCLVQVPGCRGVNNHEGSKLTEDAAVMLEILGVLKEKGLYFIDSRTTRDSTAFDAARRAGVPAASRQVFLDKEEGAAAVRARLEELFRIARDRGRAVGICHPRPATFAALEEANALAARYGVTLVFASAIVE